MSEELKAQIEAKMAELKIEEPKTESDSSEMETPQVDEVQQKAIEMGWDPNHKGPNFVSAKEFVERGSFFRKIDAQNKKIDDLLNVVKGLDEHNRKVAEAAYKQGMEEALRKRQEAVEVGDIAQFTRADNEVKALEQQNPVAKQAQVNVPDAQQNVVTQDMIDFLNENKEWLNNNTPENSELAVEADWLYGQEKRRNPYKSDKEILQTVKGKMEVLHPERFENPNKSKPIAVTKGSTVQSTGKQGLAVRLTDKQRDFLKQAQAQGVKMTAEEYAKQLDMTGDLKND